MMSNLVLSLVLLIGMSSGVSAQQTNQAAPLQLRAILHDPTNRAANLFYSDKNGVIHPINFRPHDLTNVMEIQPLNGSIVLYDKAIINPEKPEESVAATCKVTAEMKKIIIVVIPAPEDSKPAYRLILINDSEQTFARGESQIISLIPVDAAIQAGEHKLQIPSGKITRLPAVRGVNEYNKAQTNFYYSKNDSWIAFTERQLNYVDATRRIFIIHATLGALQPVVTTIVDTTMPTEATSTN